MELKRAFANALVELRKNKKRNFNQTVDLIINLQKFDVKKDSVNLFIQVPHKIKDKKVCAFLEAKNKDVGVETITKPEFKKYSSKKEVKKIVKKFDFFIAQASLMPAVATSFGRVLGPAGKMPSPQIGILTSIDSKSISEVIKKINNSIKIRTKEPSLKISVGKQDMKDEGIIENISVVYNAVLKALPRGKDNIKNVQLKFSMTKPVKVESEEKR